MTLRSLVPPFVVGACLATSGSISAGLLLYSGAGFLQAAAAIVATLLVALALGVWTGYGGAEGDPVERVRRLWLFTLLAFTLAVVFSGAWELLDTMPTGRVVQGVGLALLGALPLFTGGALVGAMARPDTHLGPAPGSRLPGPGSAALAGGALGIVLASIVLFPALSPTAMLLLTVVVLSGAALFHGWTLDSRFLGRLVERRPTPDGEFRVVDEVRGRPRALRRVLLQDGVVRAAEDEGGRPARGVDRAVAEVLRGRYGLKRVLFLGGGGFTLPRILAEERPKVEVTVVEPSRALAAVAQAHFPVMPSRTQKDDSRDGEAPDDALEDGSPPWVLRHAEWWEARNVAGSGYDVVVVDVGALFPLSPVSGLVGGGLERLMTLLDDDGQVLLAGVRPGVEGQSPAGASSTEHDDAEPLEPLLEEARTRFGTVRLQRTEVPPASRNGGKPSSLAGDRRDVLVLEPWRTPPDQPAEGVPAD